jgi:uncharacterized protein YifE (UPF0438 family)
MKRWEKSKISDDGTHHTLNGTPLYNLRFDLVMSFHEPGIAPVKKSERWFYIFADGSRVSNKYFDRAWGYYEGLAAVVKDGKAFHVLPNGVSAYDQRFSWVGNFKEGRCTVRDFNARYFHILPDGNRLYSKTYAYAGDFYQNAAVVQEDNGYHRHIDLSGNPIYKNLYEDLGVFHKGLAAARDSAGWFHINRDGKAIYSERYLSVEPFYNGRARVTKFDCSIIIIDEQGKILDVIKKPKIDPIL